MGRIRDAINSFLGRPIELDVDNMLREHDQKQAVELQAFVDNQMPRAEPELWDNRAPDGWREASSSLIHFEVLGIEGRATLAEPTMDRPPEPEMDME